MMPSPFPGMNPYLEQESAWHDFHESFMPVAREILSAQLLPRYFIKIDEHIYIHEVTEDQRRFLGRGDVTVAPVAREVREHSATQVLEAPAHVLLPTVDVEGLSFLEIRDRHNRALIAVLELLSPSNKHSGPDRDQYVTKREQLLTSQAHFVEIDLLRGGPRMPFVDLPACDYYAMASRVEERPRAALWPIRLRERLPEIRIPLREGDAPARLDLQQVLHRIYDAAGYGLYIYQGQPDPPLGAEDADWARQFLPAQA
jgi:hypothetical protein